MTSVVNKTNRVIVVDGLMLIPGKAQQVNDVKELSARYPRLAELMEAGDVAEEEAKATNTAKQGEQTTEQVAEEENRPLNRRKRG